MRRIRLSIVFLTYLLSANLLALEFTGGPTPTELAALPRFCQVRLGAEGITIASPEFKMWAERLGNDFEHTHHYCLGLVGLSRYQRARSPQDKTHYLQSAVGDFSYMVRNAKPTYVLMSDVYLQRGLAYSLLKRNAEAIGDMYKALELNPRTAKGYNMLSDIYVGMNDKSRALDIVTTGLQNNPSSTSLQARYRALGGKLPFPEPIEVVPGDAAKPGDAKTGEGEARSEAIVGGPAAPTSTAVTAPAEPKKGPPKNPNCRFCPD
jgi:tetratricopeptide (TPR) repeat protein